MNILYLDKLTTNHCKTCSKLISIEKYDGSILQNIYEIHCVSNNCDLMVPKTDLHLHSYIENL